MVRPSQIPTRSSSSAAVSSRALGPPRILSSRNLAAASGTAFRSARDVFEDGEGNHGAAAATSSSGRRIAPAALLADRQAEAALEMLSSASAAPSPKKILSVSPVSHLAFTGPFNHRSRSKALLTNHSEDQRVVYRVKSTAPKGRLAVKPFR